MMGTSKNPFVGRIALSHGARVFCQMRSCTRAYIPVAVLRAPSTASPKNEFLEAPR